MSRRRRVNLNAGFLLKTFSFLLGLGGRASAAFEDLTLTIASLRAAAIAAASLLLSVDALAMTFDERWRSLFAESEVSGEAVAAKAEMIRGAARPARVHRHRAARHRVSHRRGERRREWYKGGKKWHYVSTRKRRR